VADRGLDPNADLTTAIAVQARRTAMIWKRWVAAVVGVPAVLGVCWWGAEPFAAMITAVAAIAGGELVIAQRRAGIRTSLPIAVMGLAGPAIPLIFPSGLRASSLSLSSMAGLAVALLLSGFVYEVAAAQKDERPRIGANVGAGLLCAAYTALFAGISLLREPIRLRSAPLIAGVDPGFFMVVLVLCCVWASDTAAYYVGLSMGSRKLAPVLSPAKTVEGAVGGFVAAVVVGAVLGHFLLGRALLGWWIGAIAGTAGQIGDLFESGLKRELGIKDSGGIIPGHGGMLDRFDSLLFVAPMVWLLLQIAG